MILGHYKSKFVEFRTKILVQTIAEFFLLQTDTKFTITSRYLLRLTYFIGFFMSQSHPDLFIGCSLVQFTEFL